MAEAGRAVRPDNAVPADTCAATGPIAQRPRLLQNASTPISTAATAAGRSAEYRILAEIAKPGCLFCRAEGDDLQRFFFWYLNELYFEASSLEKMEQALGFCRRHTRHFLQLAPSAKVSMIYAWTTAPYLQRLRVAPVASGPLEARARAKLVASLSPRGACPACESERVTRGTLLSELRQALSSAPVREAWRLRHALCLAHLATLAPFFSWEELCFLVGSALIHLQSIEGAAQAGAAHLPTDLAAIVGSDLDAVVRTDRPRETGQDGQVTPPGNPGQADTDDSLATWSPTLAELHRSLREQVCPVCQARQHALAAYLAWLAHEVLTSRSFQGDEQTSWLCRVHSWDFATQRYAPATERLLAFMATQRAAQLRRLATALHQKPPDHLIARVAHFPSSLRRVREERGWQIASSPGRLAAALQRVLETPGHRLGVIRGETLRQEPCPACAQVRTAAVRAAALLGRALGDPPTSRLYQQTPGVCLRDLPLVLSQCREGASARELTRAALVRLEVLHWENDEKQRKESWSQRHEPRGSEQTAWSRFAAQVTGSYLEDGTCIGAG